MTTRLLAALIVTVPLLVLGTLLGGWAGVIFVAIFGSVLVAIVIDERS